MGYRDDGLPIGWLFAGRKIKGIVAEDPDNYPPVSRHLEFIVDAGKMAWLEIPVGQSRNARLPLAVIPPNGGGRVLGGNHRQQQKTGRQSEHGKPGAHVHKIGLSSLIVYGKTVRARAYLTCSSFSTLPSRM